MVVGLSLLTLVPGVVGGSERYARELTKALARVGGLEYRAFLPTIAPDAADGLPSLVVAEYRASQSTPGRIVAMSRASVAPGRLLRRMDLESLDALHFPLSVMIPRVERPPAATTVHDLQHDFYPQFFSRAELAYRRRVYGWTLRRSRIVIAVSEHARETLIERHGLDPERVRTIHHGLDHERFRPEPGHPRESFLLYPAGRWRHKNHERLFEAFGLVRRERPDLRLVLTGYESKEALPEGIESRGRVSDDELVGLYRSAGCLVFPSLYEGFGLPPLEAMACGCPVAVARATSLPEVCGDAAEYFNPESAEDMATAVLRALSVDRVDQGLARAAEFSWDACGRAHDAVYRELAES